jgi:eukaryotic-like serine/threonine-protein kinase
MSRDELISDILLNWDDLCEQGQEPSPEDLCREHPELRDDVERRIRALRKMYRVPNAYATQPEPGRSVSGERAGPHMADYEILELLGSGGMGKVFKARQRSLKRLVALKMILAGYAATAEETERFHTEAEAAAALQHPHIVQIYEIGKADGCPYLALEYVDGGSLFDRLRSGPLPPRQAADLVRTLARAMHYAHQRGIIHRDLKPANILLGEDGAPKITDFGLAKRLDELTQTRSGSVLGTPSYMAPEQAEGRIRQIGPRSDIYALGAVLYECLTGRPPFEAASLLETLELVRSQEPQSPRRLHPEVPLDLETICLKCLQKDPARRYGSADELADDLGRFLDGEPIRARTPSLKDRLEWMLNRSRNLSDLKLSGALLGVIGPLPFLIHLTTFALTHGRDGYPWAMFVTTLVAMPGLIGLYFLFSGDGRRIPMTPTNRHLWSVRVGQIMGITALPVISQMLHPPGQDWNPLTVYPLWTLLTGVTFFALGGIYWGRFYLLGLALVGTALLMPLWLEMAPLAFSFLLSVTLTLAIRHVRRWQAEQASGDSGSGSRPSY